MQPLCPFLGLSNPISVFRPSLRGERHRLPFQRLRARPLRTSGLCGFSVASPWALVEGGVVSYVLYAYEL